MRRTVPAMILVILLLTSVSAQTPVVPRIVGETKYKPHGLVRLQADGVDAKAAILWRVHPSTGVHKATNPRGLLEFAAPHGSYEVELLVITSQPDGSLSIAEARASVTIESCHDTPPPKDKEQPKPQGGGKLDPVNALSRIRFGNAGCTATVIGPRRVDGKWDVLTAAHCLGGIGQRGTMFMKDGRQLSVRVLGHYKASDVCWLVTEDEVPDMPYAMLAEKNPEPMTAVWHMGYGIDNPGNKEEGIVAERANSDGQLRMILSVSSGDSGGGIFRKDTNEVIATVCCTSGMAQKVSMWGGCAEFAGKVRPKPADDSEGARDWTPLPIPICGNRDGVKDWTPLPIPIRQETGANKE
jgi:hypothetical protein